MKKPTIEEMKAQLEAMGYSVTRKRGPAVKRSFSFDKSINDAFNAEVKRRGYEVIGDALEEALESWVASSKKRFP